MTTNLIRSKSTASAGVRMALDDWESKTQLGEVERRSIAGLQASCSELPKPSKFRQLNGNGEISEIRLMTTSLQNGNSSPILGSKYTSKNRFSKETVIETGLSNSHLEITGPIESAQQFFDWFASVEAEMERDQEDVYRNYQLLVGAYRDACHDLSEKIENTETLFQGMSKNFEFVESRTKSVQTECEVLMDEQTRLGEMAEAIASKLAYFKELDTATRMLNLPGENIVLNDDFLPMLDRVDVCMEYMQANPEYKDADLYLFKFRQCMTRAMTLIKMYFISTLRQLGTETIRKVSETILNDTTMDALLFGKFRSVALELKTMMGELERRALGYNDYKSLLNDSHLSYFATRQQSLIPIVSQRMIELGPNGDLLGFARGGCTFMRQLCLDEYRLFFQFFETGEDALYGHLETLCGHLQDYLRPRIIHEMDMSVLSEMCTVLKSLMMLDGDDENDEEQDGDDDDNDDTKEVKDEQEKRRGLQFSFLIQSTLQDTQTRLVFRASNYLGSDVKNFTPTASDLDYPNKLDGQQVLRDTTKNEVVSIINRAEKSTWYPALNRTLWILKKLYGYVNDSVFEDIAQEAVTICRASLISASEQIKTRHSVIDGQLFLIRHLLALKEQTGFFDSRFIHSSKDLDFSQVTIVLSNILRNTSTLLNANALLGLAKHATTIPHVVESYQDAMTEVDDDLRRVCEEYVIECVKGALEPLFNWLKNANAWISKRDETKQGDFSSQEFAQMDKVILMIKETKTTIIECFEMNMKRMDKYIGDEKTLTILMSPMVNQIVDTYENFYEVLQKEYVGEDIQTKVPSIVEMKEWVESTLVNAKSSVL